LRAKVCIFAGSSLNPVDKDRRVSERIAALERVSTDTNTFWVDPRHCSAIVLLHDRAQHIGEALDGCRKSLTTMYSVVLPGNPPLENFGQLLNVFRTSRCVHRLIELNLVAGANFALGWIRKLHPRLNYSSMSLSLPPGRATLRVHMDATLQPARRIIARLLQEDAAFFREYHYLNPLLVDDADQTALQCIAVICTLGKRESFCVLVSLPETYAQGAICSCVCRTFMV
jgi:hypothetical protein